MTGAIYNTLALLFEPGQVVGVSGIRLNDTMSKKFYTDLDLAAAIIERADASGNFKGIYISLQMLKEGRTSDKRKDIASYVHLMIDFDRKTKNGNASDEERRTIEAVMQEAKQWLSGILQTEPLLADTGNGFHLVFKLQPLAANEQAMSLLKECILAVKAKFERPGLNLEIDASVSEPEQLTRCYGTWNRKYPETPARPHRQSKILSAPAKWNPVDRCRLELLAAEAPAPESAPSRNRKVGMPALREDFDIYDFCDHYDLEIREEFDKGSKTYFVLSECPMAGKKHSGDSAKSCLIVGDSLGFHCFSDDCDTYKIGDLLRRLNEEYEPYTDIFAQDEGVHGLDVEDLAAADKPDAPAETGLQEAGVDSSSPSEEPTAGNTEEPVAEAQPTSANAKMLIKVLGVVFKDPKAAFADFVIWRNRLQWIIDERAWPKAQLPLLKTLLDYERAHRRLPTRDEFAETCAPDLSDQTGAIGPIEGDITFDHAVSNLLEKAEYLDERRTLDKARELLDKDGVSQERKFQRERWSRGVSVETTRVDGSIQDHADEIFDRMAAMGLGAKGESVLSFKTPFPSINDAILSDQERCFGVIAPPNNFKTSVLLSQAYYLAKQGKPVLFVTGEHEVERLEEKITLLHGFFHRDKFALPSYKRWSDGKVSQSDIGNLRAVMDDWKGLRGVPGPLVIKHISDFDNDLEKIVAWMESTHRKYGWKALVIDPFMELLLNVDDKEKFSVAGGLCQKLLALKTGYRNGEGLIIATSFQMKKAVKGKISKLNRDPDATLADYEEVLEASEIERYSGAVQRFDMLWGVAQADERGRKGVIVCSRTRHGVGFEPFYFHVDPASHFCFESAKAPKMQIEELAEAVD
ncbi:MAG TPA: hypothetical protein VMS18_13275 [Candidatus Binatia bacterium]|nr:hypothetical protein [Candidatus Binatia bacterium]